MRDAIPPMLVLAVSLMASSCSTSNGPDSSNPQVVARIAVDTATVESDRVMELPIHLSEIVSEIRTIDSIRSFSIALDYDNKALQFNGAALGLAVSDWNGLSISGGGFNHPDRSRTTIRISARRKTSAQPMPWGEIAKLSFQTLPFVGATSKSTEIGFEFGECYDNTLGDGALDSLLHFTRHLRTDDGLAEVSDSSICPRWQAISSDLELGVGKITIKPDSVTRVRGDLSGDGQVNIEDVLRCLAALLQGDSGFTEDPMQREQRLRDLDVNGDGVPIQASDLEMVMRLTFNYLDPNFPLWPVLTWALFEFQHDPTGATAVFQSETAITMLLLDIRHDAGNPLTISGASNDLTPSELVRTDSGTVVIYDDLEGGGIANAFRPFEMRVSIEPGQRICLHSIQASTRPGIAVPVHTKESDRCD